MIGFATLISELLLIISSANDSVLCHEFEILPIETPIIEKFKDSLGKVTKKIPPKWGDPWYTFRFSTDDRYIEVSGAIILHSKPNDVELLYNGEYYIETSKFECGCEIIKKKRICHEWKIKKVLDIRK